MAGIEAPPVPCSSIPPARKASQGVTEHSLGGSGHMQALFALRLALVIANALHASYIAWNVTLRLGAELIVVHFR